MKNVYFGRNTEGEGRGYRLYAESKTGHKIDVKFPINRVDDCLAVLVNSFNKGFIDGSEASELVDVLKAGEHVFKSIEAVRDKFKGGES